MPSAGAPSRIGEATISSRDGIVNLHGGNKTDYDKPKKLNKLKLRYALPVLVRPRRSANLRPEEVNFVNDELLHTFDRVFLFKEKVEFLIRSTVDHPLDTCFGAQ